MSLILSEADNKRLEETTKIIHREIKLWQRGLKTKEEKDASIEAAIHTLIYDELKIGKEICCDEDNPLFFEVLSRLHLSPDFFKPLPDDIVKPVMHNMHVYNGVCSNLIEFKCIDHDGLLTSPDPVGKEFVLRSDLGLKAKVRILEVRSVEERRHMKIDEDDAGNPGKYLAEGSVEGYTLDTARKIVIRTNADDTKITWLGTKMTMEDNDEAFLQYPLWQEYFAAVNRQRVVIDRCLDEMTQYYLK